MQIYWTSVNSFNCYLGTYMPPRLASRDLLIGIASFPDTRCMPISQLVFLGITFISARQFSGWPDVIGSFHRTPSTAGLIIPSQRRHLRTDIKRGSFSLSTTRNTLPLSIKYFWSDWRRKDKTSSNPNTTCLRQYPKKIKMWSAAQRLVSRPSCPSSTQPNTSPASHGRRRMQHFLTPSRKMRIFLGCPTRMPIGVL